MLDEGLIDEAKRLWPHKNLNALNTVGYKELFNFFEHKIDLVQATELIKQNTRRFSKRQMTWFKKNRDIKWLAYDNALEESIRYIQTTNQF